jgi:methenyltetrahydromethanopterin cyclohydrolase
MEILNEWIVHPVIVYNAAIVHTQNAAGSLRNPSIMGDDDNSGALALVEIRQQTQNLFSTLAVQGAGWFIGQDQRRSIGEGAGHCHALALSAGKLAGQVILAVNQIDEV